PIEKANPHPSGCAGQRGQGNSCKKARSHSHQHEQKPSMRQVRSSRRTTAAYIRKAAGGNAHGHRSTKNTSTEIGYSISSQRCIVVGAFHVLMPAAEALDHSRGHARVNRRNESQCQATRDDTTSVYL